MFQLDLLTPKLKEWRSSSCPLLAVVLKGAGGKVCVGLSVNIMRGLRKLQHGIRFLNILFDWMYPFIVNQQCGKFLW